MIESVRSSPTVEEGGGEELADLDQFHEPGPVVSPVGSPDPAH